MLNTNTLLQQEEIIVTPADCVGKPHPMALMGIALFNQQQFWKAHEALEEAWKLEPGNIRHLYRGILQIGVAYFHIQRNNYTGGIKMYQRSQRWLNPFPAYCRGIHLAQLRADCDAVIAEVQRLGPGHLELFETALFKPILYTPPASRHEASSNLLNR
jgi:predicted metal-dependent hydrolase